MGCQRVPGCRADGRDVSPRESVGRKTPILQPVEHDLDGVLAREHDPVILRQTSQRATQRLEIAQRFDPNRRSGHDLGAERFELSHQLAGLLARARHGDAPAEERTHGSGRLRRA